MSIKIKGNKIKKSAAESTPEETVSVDDAPVLQTLPCIHEWEIRSPRISRSVGEKRKALARAARVARKARNRKQANSHIFEGKAAKHNNVNDGDSMSGPKDASKLYVYCRLCKRRDREIDHVLRDEQGRIKNVVEVKSGNAHIDPDQFNALQEVCHHAGAELIYKIQGGTGSERHAAKYLRENGLPAERIIII